MTVLDITKENFEEKILQAGKPALLDLYAEWCGPCKMQAPIIEEVAKELEGKVVVGRIDVDNEPELGQAFHANSIPTLAVVEDKKVKQLVVGLHSKEDILKLLK